MAIQLIHQELSPIKSSLRSNPPQGAVKVNCDATIGNI